MNLRNVLISHKLHTQATTDVRYGPFPIVNTPNITPIPILTTFNNLFIKTDNILYFKTFKCLQE